MAFQCGRMFPFGVGRFVCSQTFHGSLDSVQVSFPEGKISFKEIFALVVGKAQS